MWTATVKNKEYVNGAIKVTVDYTDGTNTVTESCIPQDKDGFRHWVKSRLATFNGGEEIDTEFAVNDVVTIEEQVVNEPTAEEMAQQAWFSDYFKLQQVQKLIELNVLTGNETPVTNLRNKVKNNFLPAYIDAL
jgi:type IV secretory pathway VirD2 relaxase